jgi:hypothetical protein
MPTLSRHESGRHEVKHVGPRRTTPDHLVSFPKGGKIAAAANNMPKEIHHRSFVARPSWHHPVQ